MALNKKKIHYSQLSTAMIECKSELVYELECVYVRVFVRVCGLCGWQLGGRHGPGESSPSN